jgi:hypothetical protein
MDARAMLERVLATLAEMEALQARKVLELARRLRPGLTAEDVRNPHDFPDLDDPDWHFEDGQLAGIQAARFALASLSSDLGGDGGEAEGEAGQGGGAGAGEGAEDRAVLPAVRGPVEGGEGAGAKGREGRGRGRG